jgi:hypothetical protein
MAMSSQCLLGFVVCRGRHHCLYVRVGLVVNKMETESADFSCAQLFQGKSGGE